VSWVDAGVCWNWQGGADAAKKPPTEKTIHRALVSKGGDFSMKIACVVVDTWPNGFAYAREINQAVINTYKFMGYKIKYPKAINEI